MSSPATVSPRKRRREIILEAAATLFIERGYPGTGINDIGPAAGISGPGLYRHFASKDEILTEIFDRAWRRIAPPSWIDDELSAEERLRYLVSSHTKLAVEEAEVVQLWQTEHRHLPPTYMKRSLANFAAYARTWASTLTSVRTDLDDDEAHALVATVIAMINASAAALPAVSADVRYRVVYGAALGALYAPLDVDIADVGDG